MVQIFLRYIELKSNGLTAIAIEKKKGRNLLLPESSLGKQPFETIEDLVMPFFGYDPCDFAVYVSSSPIRHLVLAWIVVLPYYIFFHSHLDIPMGYIDL